MFSLYNAKFSNYSSCYLPEKAMTFPSICTLNVTIGPQILLKKPKKTKPKPTKKKNPTKTKKPQKNPNKPQSAVCQLETEQERFSIHTAVLLLPLVHLLASPVSPLLLPVISQSFRTTGDHQEPVSQPAAVTLVRVFKSLLVLFLPWVMTTVLICLYAQAHFLFKRNNWHEPNYIYSQKKHQINKKEIHSYFLKYFDILEEKEGPENIIKIL